MSRDGLMYLIAAFFAFESLQFEPCLNMIIFERKGTSTNKAHFFV